MADSGEGSHGELQSRNPHEEMLKAALASDVVPHLYFNGFVNSVSTGDVLIVLKQNERPVVVLNTSYTVAKTLVEKLGELVAGLEDATKNTIMTTDQIESALTGLADSKEGTGDVC